jgi:Protein of unknown function (DUF1553)
VDGKTTISASGYVSEVNRRAELARLIVGSDYMPQAIVNRVWGQLFGYGFTKPVDDMGPHNPPSHPELLALLAKEFRASGYDLKSLVKWCTLNDAYALSSKFNGKNAKDDPSSGELPQFSHFYLRQMSAEQLYESLLTAVHADATARGSFEDREKRKADWLQQFTIAFGTDEGDEATTFNGTIPQVLMMMNGDLTKDAIRDDQGSLLGMVAKSAALKDPQKKIGYLYMAAFSRQPNKREMEMANQLWQAHKGDGMAAAQDVWWVLLNSNEFILNH